MGISTFSLHIVDGIKIDLCKTIGRINSIIKMEIFLHIFSPNRLEQIWILLVKHIIITIYLGTKKKNNSSSWFVFNYNILCINDSVHELSVFKGAPLSTSLSSLGICSFIHSTNIIY